jgi:hypothetical protein
MIRGPSRRVGFPPSADLAADTIKFAGGVFVAAFIEVVEVERKPHQMAQFLNAEIGGAQARRPVAIISRLDQPLQHIERGGLDSVAEQELLAAWEILDRGDKPAQKAVHRFERGANGTLRVRDASGLEHRSRMRRVGPGMRQIRRVKWMGPPARAETAGSRRDLAEEDSPRDASEDATAGRHKVFIDQSLVGAGSSPFLTARLAVDAG